MSRRKKRGPKADDKVALPKGAVGTFMSPRTGARIWVYPKKGESRDAALSRVKRNHGAS